MPRLPYPDSDKVPQEVRRLLEARPPRNVFRMMSHAPALMPGSVTSRDEAIRAA